MLLIKAIVSIVGAEDVGIMKLGIRIKVTVLTALAVCLMACYTKYLWKYHTFLSEAEHALRASRGGTDADPASFQFMVHGVQYGMTVDEVDNALRGACEKFGPVEVGTPSSRLYRFCYGKPYRDLFDKEPEYLLREELHVFFNAQGHAYRIFYMRVGPGSLGMTTKDITLREDKRSDNVRD